MVLLTCSRVGTEIEEAAFVPRCQEKIVYEVKDKELTDVAAAYVRARTGVAKGTVEHHGTPDESLSGAYTREP